MFRELNQRAGVGIGLAAVLMGTARASAQAWTPVWADEFNGTTLDSTSWTYQTGTGAAEGLAGWGNNEQQYYTSRPENIFVSGGMLNIVARAESYLGSNYTSARIRTIGLREFKYGRFEVRMKVPALQGGWPAFWALPAPGTPYGGWASSGEIDMFETVNFADKAYGTIHYGGPWPTNASTGSSSASGGALGNAFHTYRVEWEPDQIRWYLDDVLYTGVTSTTWYSTAAPSNDRAPFDVPFYLLLNLAIGGNWPGSPNGSVGFPATLQVDYVRVSQRPAKGPWGGVAPVLPARVEAENFDLGGGSVAYSDSDYNNVGNNYRTDEAVDIEPCSEGGYDVGWIRANEWTEYTINVPRAGQYDLRARVASASTGGSFRLEFGGVDKTGAVAVPVTTGFQVWRTVRRLVTLSAGVQSVRFVNLGPSSQEYNVNYFDILVPGDVNGDGVTDIRDLYTFAAGGGINRDVDGDGTAGTTADRKALIGFIRGAESVGTLTP